MLVSFYNAKGIIHKEFVPSELKVNVEYFPSILKYVLNFTGFDYR